MGGRSVEAGFGGRSHDGLARSLGRIELGDDAALGKDQDAIGNGDELGEVRRNHDQTDPLSRQAGDKLMDLNFRADVDAGSGVLEEQNLRVGGQPFGQQHLLLVAAGEIAHERRGQIWPDAQLRDVPASRLSLDA